MRGTQNAVVKTGCLGHLERAQSSQVESVCSLLIPAPPLTTALYHTALKPWRLPPVAATTTPHTKGGLAVTHLCSYGSARHYAGLAPRCVARQPVGKVPQTR